MDIDPQGNSRDIGSELELIVGIEEWQKLELVLSRFEAGRAFTGEKGEVANKLSFELSYRL